MKQYVKGDFEEQHGYSRAVCASGQGRTVYLAGFGCPYAPDGRSLRDDFGAQVRGTVAQISRVLEGLGGGLSDLVDVTVFVTDLSQAARLFQEWTSAIGGDYPAGTLVQVEALALPEMLIEVKGVALIDGYNTRAG
ncbi:MAG: RidA family protein [Chloroflexi bacterium]|nr:RidA family protein [Chloroflexota bacterium]